MFGTCKLCLRDRDLRDSHVVPAWAHERAKPLDANSHPVILDVTRHVAVMTSKQVSEYMLCEECEQRFSKVENIVSRIAYQKDATAPFLDFVGNVIDVSDEDDGIRLALPGRLPIPELIHFGASIVWRASVATQSAPKCSLGKHEEAFRHYLLGETEFPECAACLIAFHDLPLVDDLCLALMFTLPVTTNNPGYDNHRFTLFGLHYIIGAGDQLPPSAKRRCALRGDDGCVYLLPQGQLVEYVGPGTVGVRKVGKLRRVLAALDRNA